MITASGGEMWGAGNEPYTPGWSLHETGTCRMGNDPSDFVTNRFGQLHDAPNVFVADASVFLVQRQDDHPVDPRVLAAGERIPGRGDAQGRDRESTAPAPVARRGACLTEGRGLSGRSTG